LGKSFIFSYNNSPIEISKKKQSHIEMSSGATFGHFLLLLRLFFI